MEPIWIVTPIVNQRTAQTRLHRVPCWVLGLIVVEVGILVWIGKEKATEGWPDDRLQKLLELLCQARPRE